MKTKKGLIYNIQHYSIHDGPGIRTTVFFKGCKMICPWCHNPESQNFKKQLIYNRKKCIGCKKCISICENNAINLHSQDEFPFDNEKCISCFKCAEACPSNAIQVVGKEYSQKELMDEIKKDMTFFEDSNGGVTFSGGEPLSQSEFLKEILIKCKNTGIHTAVDTSGYGPVGSFESIIPYCDLFLFDIKNINADAHFAQTGIQLQTVLENLKLLIESEKRIWIRIPIIPALNDDMDGYRTLCQVLKDMHKSKSIPNEIIEKICLLPFHDIGKDKYSRLGSNYTLGKINKPDPDFIASAEELFISYGFKVQIGG